MKKLVISIIFIITMIPAFAQIEDEIQQTKKVKIENGRAYLLEKFLERDYEKVKEIKDHLKGLEDDNYCAFYPWELWQLLYWTSEFDELAVEFGIDSTDYHALDTKVLPDKDQLNKQLYQHSVEDEHILRSNLQEAKLKDEDNEFFSIFLDWNLKPLSSENQKIVNEELDKFLADYPNTRYEWVANNIIHMSYYEQSAFGSGFIFDLCSGFSTGLMQKPVFGIGIGLAIVYKKLELDLGFNIMAGKTRNDQILSNDSLYPKGSHVNIMPFYANLNYNIVDNKIIRVSPSLGIGYDMEGYPTAKNSHNKELNKNYFILQGGIVCDFKLKHNDIESHYIRVRYNCGVSGLDKGEVSTLHVISLGWTGIVTGRKLVK